MVHTPDLTITLPESGSHVLYFTLKEELEQIHITAQQDGHQGRTVRIDKDEYRISNLELYQGLESRRISEAVGRRLIEKLGRQVLGPFKSLIQSAKEIVFVIPLELLETPIDLLHHTGQPLFLQKPVSYRVWPHIEYDSVFNLPASAFIVSDTTADPERAAKAVARFFDDSMYLDVNEVDPGYIRKQHEFDLLLMSVHGKIENGSKDHIVLGSGATTATDLATIRPSLAYFDSCRLGVSREFLSGFTEMGSRYFVAPVLSNEAGNSSTKTIQLFFEHLQQGERPEIALFHTRKKLWEIYGNEEFAYRVWRAFPFRVYRLN